MTEIERAQLDEQAALRLAQQHHLTLPDLSNHLLTDLCRGLPAEYADRALRLFHATLRLQGIAY
jgi:hypothetical protein